MSDRLSISRDIIIVENDHVPGPMTCRTFKPVVILPVGFGAKLTDDDLTSVAVHEMSHIRRNDMFVLTLVSFVRAVFFFQPFVWLAAREIAFITERSCDTAVLDYTKTPTLYAAMLARLARELPKQDVTTEFAAGIVFSKSMFMRRVEAILSKNRDRLRRLSKRALVGTSIASLTILVVALSLPLSEAKEKSDMVEVLGIVEYDGVPVSKAKVYVVSMTFNRYGPDRIESEAKSKRDGTFSIMVPEYAFNQERPMTVLRAYHKKYGAGNAPITVNTSDYQYIIPLSESLSIGGHIKDKNDKPVKGAVVSLLGVPELNAKTDRKGNYSITGSSSIFSSLYGLRLHITADGYAKSVIDRVQAGSMKADCELDPESVITGRIVFADTGKPARDIQVYATSVDFKVLPSEFVSTGRDGSFTIPNLKSGIYHVALVTGEKVDDWTASAVKNITVETGKTTGNIELQLIKGGIVTGTVTDDESGEALSGVSVSARPGGNNSRYSFGTALTDSNGRYRLRCAPGNVEIRSSSPITYLREHAREEVEIEEGVTFENMDFTFNSGLILNGRVLTQDGDPIPNTVVEAPPMSGWRGKVVADSTGAFAISGIQDSTFIRVKILDPVRQLYLVDEIKVHDGDELELTPEPYELASVEGRIVNEDGEPVKSVALTLYRSWKDINAKPPRSGMTAVSNKIVAMTDEEGTYQVNGLIAVVDDGNVNAEASGFKKESIFQLGDLQPGVNDLGDMNLEWDQTATGWIRGEIVDTMGNPIVGVRLSTQYKGDVKQAYTDADGKFKIEGLKEEIVAVLNVWSDDYGNYHFHYIKTGKKHSFVLHPLTGTISGFITDTDGTPVKDVGVRHYEHNVGPSGISNYYTKVDKKGRFTIKNLVDESYTITCYTRDQGYAKIENVKVNTDSLYIVLDKNIEYTPTPEDEAYMEYRKSSKERRSAMTDSPAPELAIDQWLKGRPLLLSKLKGKVVVLYFWDSEIHPTVKPYMVWNHFHRKYRDKGLVIIAVHG